MSDALDYNTVPQARPQRRDVDIWIALALVALVAIVFGRTIGFDYLGYDDPFYVTDNAVVQQGLTWEGVRWAFTRSYEAGGTYAPLTFLTHMLDCQLFGLSAGGHHLTNVVLHAVNCATLYLALLALSRRRWPSALAAALFTIHPLRVESVAWIAERKDLLSGLFFMLCVLAYAKYAHRPSLRRYLLVALFLAMGLMSKPMLVTVPALFLVLDVWPLKRTESWRRLWVEKLPLFALALAAAGLTVVTQRRAGFVRSLDQFPLGFRMSNAVVSYARYVGKTFWPFDLACYYPPPAHWPAGIGAACAMSLLGVTAIAVATMRRRPWLLVGWLWFLGTLVPVIGLVQVGRQAMADRYSYIPQIGVLVALAWAAAALAERSAATKHAVVTVAILILLALMLRTFDQTRHWQNTQTLAEHALDVTENNNVAMVLVGNARVRNGHPWEAETLYRNALRIDPDYGMAHLNLGNLLVLRREFADAADHFRAAIRWRPQLERAHLGLAVALRGLREYEQSDQEFAEALRLNPRLAEAHVAWGSSFKERGRRDLAAAHFRAALSINPQLAVARRELADVQAVPFVSTWPSTAPRSPPQQPTTAPEAP